VPLHASQFDSLVQFWAQIGRDGQKLQEGNMHPTLVGWLAFSIVNLL
jgi:hypothetical protein